MALDFAVVAVCLLFLIVGIIKGFSRSLFSLIGWVGAIIFTFLLTSNFANFLQDNFSIYSSINDYFLEKFNTHASLTTPIVLDGLTNEQINEAVKVALSDAGIPGLIANLIAPNVAGAIEAGTTSITLSGIISNVVTKLCIFAIAGIILFILFRILAKLLEVIIGKIVSCTFIMPIDKALGAVLGLTKGICIVYALLLLLTPFSSATFMSGYKEQLDDSSLAIMMAENNVLGNILFDNLDIKGWIKEIIDKDVPAEQESEQTSLPANYKPANKTYFELYNLLNSKLLNITWLKSY